MNGYIWAVVVILKWRYYEWLGVNITHTRQTSANTQGLIVETFPLLKYKAHRAKPNRPIKNIYREDIEIYWNLQYTHVLTTD